VLLFEEGLVPLLLLGLWIYAIFDVIATDDALVRNLPKGLWLMIVIFLPDVGSLAWLLLGRPLFAGWRPGDTTRRTPKRAIGPEDRDDWRGSSYPPATPRLAEPRPSADDQEDRLAAWERDLARREEEMRRREEGEGS
jgi:hypothetical protein